MKRVICPVCDCEASYVKRVYICGNCGHRYRPVDDLDPVSFHNDIYRTYHQRRQNEVDERGVNEVFHSERSGIVEERIKRIGRFLSDTDTVLDVGGGAGTFAIAVKPLVASVTVSEVNDQLLAECRRNGLKTIKSSMQDMPLTEAYDVVFSWHSLEHCEPLAPAARNLKSLFRKYLVIEIPKERGAPERFDGHYQFFSDQSLQLLFHDLVVRYYDEGVQEPARLVVFEKKRNIVQQERRLLQSRVQADAVKA